MTIWQHTSQYNFRATRAIYLNYVIWLRGESTIRLIQSERTMELIIFLSETDRSSDDRD